MLSALQDNVTTVCRRDELVNNTISLDENCNKTNERSW